MDPQFEARERLQTSILRALFETTEKDEIALKGGMALRVSLDSHRATKDIDISGNPDVPVAKLRKKIRAAIQSAIRQVGLTDAQISDPKQTETTSRWKVRGKLSNGLDVMLTVEMSGRPPFSEDHITTKLYSPPKPHRIGPFFVNLYDEPSLIVAKILALTDEKRTALRDLYDLHLLIEQGATPAQDLFRRIGRGEIAGALQRLPAKLEIMRWPLFQQEVMPYLPDEVSSRLNENWYESMKTSVYGTVSDWLQKALESATAPAEAVSHKK